MVLDDAFFVQCPYVLALIHSQWSIEKINVVGATVTVQCARFIIEIARATDSTDVGSLVRRKELDLTESRRKNELPPSLPIVVLVSGTVGPLVKRFPHSIVGGADQTDIVEGPSVIDCHWHSLEQRAKIVDANYLVAEFGSER